VIGQWLSERLGQPIIVENRPGAGTNLGTEAVVRAPADGYTLLIFGAVAAINATLYALPLTNAFIAWEPGFGTPATSIWPDAIIVALFAWVST
jgi:hypothetical protein